MLLLGPLFAVLLGGWLDQCGAAPAICWTAGVTALCATWWITEAIDIPVTSLIPLIVFPLVGVLTPGQVGEAYGSPLVLLMMGGFMLSRAMERSEVHRRIALSMVQASGGSNGRRLIFGFMAASALLSMWISNAATTLMLLPIGLAVLEDVEDERFRTALLLGIAYAASLGGIGTPVGTPPNLVFLEIYRENTGDEPTFLRWMSWSLPITLIMLPITGIWLTRGLKTISAVRLPPVGRWRKAEIRTLLVFAITATLWITRKQPYGGWSCALDLPTANDASVALAGVVAMCLVPDGKGGKLLDWTSAASIEWGILILFGGGISIAKAFSSSGLAESLGTALAEAGALPPVVMLAAICLVVTFMTEVTSNTATSTVLLPILAVAAKATGVDAKLLMVPATISASFAFMLPVATPPNAIVFGGAKLSIRTMAREGLMLNLLGAIVVATTCYLLFR